MPLPLVIIPTAYAVVTTATAASTASTTTAAVIGISALSIDITALAYGIKTYFFSPATIDAPTQRTHLPRKMQEISDKRMVDAVNTVKTTVHEVNEGTDKALAAIGTSLASTQQLEQSIEALAETRQQLQETAEIVATSSDTIVHAVPVIEALSTTMQDNLNENMQQFDALSEALSARQKELLEAKTGIEALSGTIVAQAETISVLTESLQQLTAHNGELKTTIERQEKDYKKLETEARRAFNNHRLFRQVVDGVAAAATVVQQNAPSPLHVKMTS